MLTLSTANKQQPINNNKPKEKQMNLNEMFAPTSGTEAAEQSNATTKPGITTLIDTYRKGVQRVKLAEGNNWLRFITLKGEPWVFPFELITCKQGNNLIKLASPTIYGEFDLFQHVQIGLYATHKPYMFTRENRQGFHFDRRSKAVAVCSQFEGALSPFGLLEVSVGKDIKDFQTKQIKYKASWGDGLLALPKETVADPLNPNTNEYRWGSIADAEKGRLILAKVQNAGQKEMSVQWQPQDKIFPLVKFEGTNVIPTPGCEEVLKSVPRIKDAFVRLTVAEQAEIIRKIVPSNLLVRVNEIIDAHLGKTSPAPAIVPIAIPTKPVVQMPIPVEDPEEAAMIEQMKAVGHGVPAPVAPVAIAPAPAPVVNNDPLLAVLKASRPQAVAEVGEEVIKRLITKGIINQQNCMFIIGMPSEALRAMAV